jgi:hypothetical protein
MAEQELFNAGSCINVNCAWDMASSILIIEPTIDDVEISDLILIFAIKQPVQLQPTHIRLEG